MKQAIKQIVVFGLLGAWAMIAITSSSSHGLGCTEEWKVMMETNANLPATSGTDQATDPVDELYFPGLRTLILQ